MIARSEGYVNFNKRRQAGPCNCPDCQNSFFMMDEQQIDRYAYNQVLTNAQAKSILAGNMEDISTSQRYLVESTERYGDRILTRWRKLTQSKRTTILQTAEPNIPLHKGFIIETELAGATWETQRTYRKYHLLPYLDVDTLVRNPAVLLNLIHIRASNSPVDWVSFDNEQLRTAWSTGLFDVDFNPGAVIMYGSHYGSWTPWEEKAAHRADILGFPRGRIVIEAQATLMKFLQTVVQLLLAGSTEEEAPSSVKWQQFLAGGLKTIGEAATWSTFVYRPFAAPPRFEPDTLLAIVRARRDATGDHVWLMQTEPSYFKRYIRKLRQTQVVELSNDKHASATSVHSQIAHGVQVHWLWRNVVGEFENLQATYQRYRDSIRPGAPLPPKVERALGSIELVLVNTIHDRSKHLQAVITDRPGFRHMYDFGGISHVAERDGESFQVRMALKKKYTETSGKLLAYREERIWFILVQLLGPPDEEKRYRYAMLLDMLDEHLGASSPAERGRLDEVLYDIVSDYITLVELLWTIRTHMPLYASRTIDECAQTENSLFWRQAKHRHHKKHVSSEKAIEALRKFQNTAPPSGQRNRQWLNQFEALHSTSQEFWKATAAGYEQIYRNLLPGVQFEQNMGFLFAWRDKQYTGRLEAKRKQILTDMQKPQAPESEDFFLPLPPAIEQKVKLSVVPPKSKIKTRGEGKAEDDPPVEQLATELEATRVTIHVSKRSYATFRYIFPVTPEERQKSIDWNTFVDSMTDAGFAASNGGGSIVTFENTIGGGKIIFHRPHPEPTVDPIMLQSMGNRLNRWFGWTRETFALVKK
ncbi:hypothetical protein BDU57DRAFT_442892 [Ampelomyces quisqualis]|uniref:Uncharacterized protein n=1 Tax=Ampelomyces quisqualis TaxID=50730 RepID=A0A6A5QYR0_AMPQU|nr:hypothetical protein BDU57DRAFT_442892 [Ampelomyces quisqualis]